MDRLSPEIEELLESTFKLKNALAAVLPKEAVDHIISLVVKDNAHRKFLKLTEESE